VIGPNRVVGPNRDRECELSFSIRRVFVGESDRSINVNSSSQPIEFVDDDLNIEYSHVISELQASSLLWDNSFNNYSDT